MTAPGPSPRLTPATRAAIALVGFVGAVGVAAATTLVLGNPYLEDKALLLTQLLLIGIAFTATGMFAWARRPDSRFGLQLCAIGLLWFVTGLTASRSPALFAIGWILSSLYAGVIVHALLAFPTGRLRRRSWERRFVTAVYVAMLLCPLAVLLVTPLPYGVPDNPLLLSSDPRLGDIVDAVMRALAFATAVGATALLVARWGRATTPERRLLAPVLWCGTATAALFALALAGELLALPGQVLNVLDLAGLAIFASVPFAFLAGILLSNVWRADSVGRLIARLGDAPVRGSGAGSLRDALATALRDRSLALAYWLPAPGHADAATAATGANGATAANGAGATRVAGTPAAGTPAAGTTAPGRYVDADGAPVTLPQPGSGRAYTEVEHDGRRVAAIIHDASLNEEPELVRAAGAAAALALENERLDAELRVQIAEVRESRRRLLEVVTRERRRIERDLHDGAQQRLVALALTLGIAETQVTADPQGAQALIAEAREEARRALEELRELARGIHPAILTDRGLGPALESLARRAPLPVELARVPQERLPAPVEGAAYFVVAEALANVAKYAGATHAEVAVARRDGHAVVEVRDDGVGGADPGAGTGLRGLEDRLSALDGTIEVTSPSGGGTTIRAEIPCAS